MAEIHMIGVNHLDHEGPSKLERCLRTINPELILLEGSLSQTKAQEKYLEILREEISQRGLDPKMIAPLLEEQELKGYESRVARSYCELKKLFPPKYLNDSYEARSEQEIKELVRHSIDNFIGNFTSEPAKEFFENIRKSISLLYQIFAKVMDTPKEPDFTFLLPKHHLNVWEKDKQMEFTLRTALDENLDIRLATITGFAHLIINPKRNSFYCRVKDLKPNRMILYKP